MQAVPIDPQSADVDFHAVFDAAPLPYLLLRPDAPRFTIAAVNAAYLTATGTVRDEIVGRGLFEVFPDNPDDPSVSGVSDLRSSLERVIRDREADVMGVQKYDIPLRDGSDGFEVRYWSPVNSPVPGPDGAVRYIIHRVEDITEFILVREREHQESAEKIADVRQRADKMEAEVLRAGADLKEANRQLKAAGKELAAAHERLTELDRAKTEFFSNVSHEFRTPLTLLLGPLEQVLNEPGEGLSPQDRQLLETAMRNARRLLRLVNNLLDFSSLEAGRHAASFTPTDLPRLTAELASGFQSACVRAGLELIVDCPPLPEPVYVDQSLWERAVLNLVSNACKYTMEGEVAVRMRLSADGRAAELEVRDTGVGIPGEELPHVFERFHRVRGVEGRSIEGSGIGLALVREVATLHGGEVSADSEPGRGSSFRVSIPLGRDHLPASQIVEQDAPQDALVRPSADEAAEWLGPRDSAPDQAVSVEGQGARIVLADDNDDMRGYMARLLRAAGYAVVEARDGVAAVAEIREELPDLVITDVMMPNLDGFGVVAALRGDVRTASLPIIMLSARAGEDARIEGLEAGADDYLVKPFSARELVARVDGGLRLTRLRRDLEAQMRQVQKLDAVGQLTGGIAHEFNNLLTAILGGLDLILKRTEEERTRRIGENALAAAERGAKLAAQLLAFSRIQRLEIRRIDLQVLVVEAREPLARVLGPGIELDISVQPAGRFAMGDPTQVELALVNLASNARDAMPDGGSFRIRVSREVLAGDPELPDGAYTLICVADTGAGMSAAVAAKAFEPFYSTKGVGGGSGLGLSQVYAAAHKCGGTARIESAEGRGTTIRLFLPAATAPKEVAKAAAANSDASADRANSPSEKIVVIDDDEQVRSFFVEGLREAGYEVAEASDGQSGLALIEREHPDALLVDYAMPGMNGSEVAKRARARRPDLPIVFATGFANSQALADIPGAKVLMKPLTLSALTQAIASALHPA